MDSEVSEGKKTEFLIEGGFGSWLKIWTENNLPHELCNH